MSSDNGETRMTMDDNICNGDLEIGNTHTQRKKEKKKEKEFMAYERKKSRHPHLSLFPQKKKKKDWSAALKPPQKTLRENAWLVFVDCWTPEQQWRGWAEENEEETFFPLLPWFRTFANNSPSAEKAFLSTPFRFAPGRRYGNDPELTSVFLAWTWAGLWRFYRQSRVGVRDRVGCRVGK